jgi:redox-sensitive bicupin YhaK (pirin superfamily)
MGPGAIMIETIIPPRRLPGDTTMVAPDANLNMIGPWAMVVAMGPTQIERGASLDLDVRPHPHINMSLMTYLFDGEVTHRDGLGMRKEVSAGEVAWMVAGRGIVHSERYERLRREGGAFHGVQAWAALPEKAEETEPSFQHFGADALPVIQGRRASGKLLAGHAHGATAPARTHAPLFFIHWSIEPDGLAPVPSEHQQRAVHVISGSCQLETRALQVGDTAIFTPSVEAAVTSHEGCELLMLGGAPMGKRFLWWNFVSSRLDRLEAAKCDWEAGATSLPPDDRDDLIPLPGPNGRPLLTLNPGN